MADTLTPNYGWVKPEVGASAATWGAKQNGVFDQIDAQVFANAQAAFPIGGGCLWFTATAPANFLIANGQSLDTTAYAKLFAVYGYAFGGSGANFLLPNFTSRFPMGAGTLAATGGEATHLLTVAEMPVHPHPIVDVLHSHAATQPAHTHGETPHTHPLNDPGHSHPGIMRPLPGTATLSAGGAPQISNGSTDPVLTGITIQGAVSNLQAAQPAITVAANGTNLSTTQNAGGDAAHNNLPPYLSINFIVRYQ